MADFDPDAYLKSKPSTGFDPDAYLAKQDFSVPTPANLAESQRQAKAAGKQEPGFVEKAVGAVEAIPAMAVNIPVGMAGQLASGGKAEEFEKFMQKYAYKPRSRGAQALLQDVGEATSGLPPVLGMGGALTGAATMAPAAVRQAVTSPAAQAVGKAAKQVTGKAGDIGEALGTKLGGVTQVLKKPEPIGEATGLREVGSKIADRLKTKVSDLYDQRRKEADTNYTAALDAARDKQAKGMPFAQSPQGQDLLQSLENDKYEVVNGQRFLKGEEQVKGIDRLINAIKGETKGGETVPVGKGLVSSKLTKKTPVTKTEKDIEALIEELRFLRDVDAKGKSYEAYAGLSARYKRDLIDKFENSLYSWNPEYQAADEAYKASSAKLMPFRTRLLEGALKGEKFDPSDLVTSVERFPQKFFTDSDAVAQLKQVTNDPKFVADTAKEYVATLFDNKNPQDIKSFVQNPKNQGWLQEAGIYDDVKRYADRAQTIEKRKDILKKIGLYSAGAAIGTTAVSKLKSLF